MEVHTKPQPVSSQNAQNVKTTFQNDQQLKVERQTKVQDLDGNFQLKPKGKKPGLLSSVKGS